MAKPPNIPKIKPLEAYDQMSDHDVVVRGTAVQTGMTGNSNFQNSPVDLAALKTNIESYSTLISEALDGSKKVIAQKDKQREAVIKMLRLLARYVEVQSSGDMAVFTSSGFPGGFDHEGPACAVASAGHQRCRSRCGNRGTRHSDSGDSQSGPLRNPLRRAAQWRCASLMDDGSGHAGETTGRHRRSDAGNCLCVSSSRARQTRLHQLDRFHDVHVHVA